jgi:uncharacterized protein GlcG (DUF336 family)
MSWRDVRRLACMGLAVLGTLDGAGRAEGAEPLTAAEVDRVVAQAAAEAARQGLRAHVAVTDAEGRLLALFRMAGAADTVRIPGRPGEGLGGRELPAGAAAHSKAGTGALLSSGGQAFSTRTASFIVQQHFPPGIDLTPGGPLFGVQFSSLPCRGEQGPALPLGLAGDPGGFPLYRAGVVVGGVGVEGDGRYGIDRDAISADDEDDALREEASALAGTRGFEASPDIEASRILADGIRLAWSNVDPAASTSSAVAGVYELAPRAGQASPLAPAMSGPVRGQVDPLLPVRAGRVLSAADVGHILEQAAAQTVRTRAAIRQPLGSHARVSIAVVDVDGRLLGFFQNEDAPRFGIDVSVQKARTAAFFSSPAAGGALRSAGLGRYVGDLPLDGSVAFSTRAVGVLAQPLFPSGIDGTDPGPFSVALPAWSPFHTGLQLDLVQDRLLGTAAGPGCTAIAALPNGITIFPGGIPVYRNGAFAGAIGVSGDGVDQDDLIAAAGSAGFEAPAERRSDRLVFRGVRLPWIKFPRHPELD